MIDFENYLRKGLVKPQQVNFKQIIKQINRAEKDLSTYSLVLDRDPEWAATIVYQAMLRAGRALLFSYGYLPADGQQHKTVVEITGQILDKRYDLVVKNFEKLRKKRNVFFYDSIDTSNLAEARKSAETAKTLIDAIKAKVEQSNPQISLNWNNA